MESKTSACERVTSVFIMPRPGGAFEISQVHCIRQRRPNPVGYRPISTSRYMTHRDHLINCQTPTPDSSQLKQKRSHMHPCLMLVFSACVGVEPTSMPEFLSSNRCCLLVRRDPLSQNCSEEYLTISQSLQGLLIVLTPSARRSNVKPG